jgi:TetR/AcrR family transcriptional regulator
MGIQERKGREKEARREEILSAAEKVFFEKGLGASTMDEVAEAAELSKGTLYLYYRSKEELYLGVTLRGMEVLYQLIKRAVSTGEDPIRLLQNMGEAYYRFFRDYRQYFRMFYFFESPDFQQHISPPMLEQFNIADRQAWDLVIEVIKKGKADGLLHGDLDPLETGIMLWSNSNGFLKLIDRNESYWREIMGIDLDRTLRKSNALLVEAMMTEKAQTLYREMLPHHEASLKTTNGTQNR